MDFEKIKPAVEDITLSEAQKQAIIAECAKTKKKSRAPIYAVAAAAAVIIIVAASPGFLLRAGSNAKKSDSCGYAEVVEEMAQSTATGEFVLFKADGYADIYSVIPSEFVLLVNYDEFAEWSGECTAEGGMALFQFVERFQIPKEDFEAANAEYSARDAGEGTLADAASDDDNKADQPAESINAELIYSFDKEKIDEYYKK